MIDDSSDTPQKQCSHCKQWYLATPKFFSRDKTAKSGLFSQCKNCQKLWRMANRDKRIQQVRQYHATHKEQALLTQRKYRASHREQHNRDSRLFFARHTEKCSQDMRQYYRAHTGAFKAYGHNRRARERVVQGTHTPQQIREQYERQKGKCYYCHKKVKWGEHHIDHTFPLSREDARNSIDHLVITCAPCNLKKGDKYPWEWPEGGRLL